MSENDRAPPLFGNLILLNKLIGNSAFKSQGEERTITAKGGITFERIVKMLQEISETQPENPSYIELA